MDSEHLSRLRAMEDGLYALPDADREALAWAMRRIEESVSADVDALRAVAAQWREVAPGEVADALRARAAEAERERDHAAESAHAAVERIQKRLDHAYETIDTFAGERDAANARAEKAEAALRDLADLDCSYGDGCPPFGTGHGQCVGCKAREALAVSRG